MCRQFTELYIHNIKKILHTCTSSLGMMLIFHHIIMSCEILMVATHKFEVLNYYKLIPTLCSLYCVHEYTDKKIPIIDISILPPITG